MEPRKFKDLTIRDAFLFAAVMTDQEICRKVLELSLGIPIAEVQVQTEKTMAYHSEYHGVRLDVYAADENQTRYNVEMQVARQDYLPKRSRYYHSHLDMDALLAGEPYEKLPDTYVIFICDFDPFGDGLYRYYTRTSCEETGKMVDDGVVSIYLSTHGENKEEIPPELLNFLNYVKNSGRQSVQENQDTFVKQLQEHIKKIKSSRVMEERYMLLEEMLRRENSDGWREGREAGRKVGRKEGTCETFAESILMALETKFPAPDELKTQITAEKDPDKLRSWLSLALKADSLEDFKTRM